VSTRSQRYAWRIAAALVWVGALTALLAGLGRFPVGAVTGSAVSSGAVTGGAVSARYAPCLPGQEVPVLASPLIPAARLASVRYNSVPPTSGPHFAFTVATGIYSAPVSTGLTVSALERGHIVVQYAPGTSRATVRRLERLAKRYGKDIVLAPYPPLRDGVAVTAWGRIDVMNRYDDRRAATFVKRLRNRYVYGWTSADDCR
jgi:Protein of unknown function (DUF3105)